MPEHTLGLRVALHTTDRVRKGPGDFLLHSGLMQIFQSQKSSRTTRQNRRRCITPHVPVAQECKEMRRARPIEQYSMSAGENWHTDCIQVDHDLPAVL